MTGLTHDPRNPHFFVNLSAYAAEKRVADMFSILGLVPYSDLMGLMTNSIAVINPSRFEGWSTSVEEAKSLGKSILLSDIPVHREQNPEYGQYFGVDDPAALADLIDETRVAYDQALDNRRQENAKYVLPLRIRKFAEKYYQCVDAAYRS
jgi:glycosyltransferase involved in cell wall biosynthesis